MAGAGSRLPLQVESAPGVEITPEGEAPPPWASGGMVYDAARRRMLVGFGNSRMGNYADLWSLSL